MDTNNKPYTEAEINEALMAVVAWAGNCAAAQRALKAEGKRCPARLAEWIRGEHAPRYAELREKYAEQLEGQLIAEYRDVARYAVEVQRAGLERAMQGLEKGSDRDPSRTAANAATVADKMTGKMLSLSGRPTSIREDRNLDEILRALAAKNIINLPDEPAQLGAQEADDK